jgi:hypothetical protein
MLRFSDVLALRLRLIRLEIFADEGAAELASMLGLPCRTWESYERGVAIPSEIPVQFIVLTHASPLWLLHGIGERFQLCPV